MSYSPFLDKGKDAFGKRTPDCGPGSNIEHAFISAVFRMKVGWKMVLPVERDGNSEESTYDRHGCIITPMLNAFKQRESAERLARSLSPSGQSAKAWPFSGMTAS